jgi:hypothetical protein
MKEKHVIIFIKAFASITMLLFYIYLIFNIRANIFEILVGCLLFVLLRDEFKKLINENTKNDRL